MGGGRRLAHRSPNRCDDLSQLMNLSVGDIEHASRSVRPRGKDGRRGNVIDEHNGSPIQTWANRQVTPVRDSVKESTVVALHAWSVDRCQP